MSEYEQGPPPAEEEQRVARAFADELRKLRVEDLLINTLVSISSIGYERLGLSPETREDRDLDQTRLAIETMRALTPVLEAFVPAELIRDFNTSVANLQLAYAKAASETAASGGQTPRQGHEGQVSGEKAHERGKAAASDETARPGEPAEEDASGGQTP